MERPTVEAHLAWTGGIAMNDFSFSDQDLRQIQAHGLRETQVREHLRLFACPRRALQLERPCTVEDGIRQIPAGEVDAYQALHAEAARLGRFTKFVPASGAATRMFEILLYYFQEVSPNLESALARDQAQGERRAREFLVFFDCLDRFPFAAELKRALATQGHRLEALLTRKRYREILEVLLTDTGLDYQTLPKALIQFHADATGSRTALEEHLVEAAAYVRDAAGVCRLHFTVLPRYREDCQRLLTRLTPALEARYDCRYAVEFSVQPPGADTLAVNGDNRPFRDADGRLVFRPGGHGALLENLNELQGDLVYLKNIDNVVPDRLKEPTILWKQILGGFLVSLQGRLHSYLRRLQEDPGNGDLFAEALEFAAAELALPVPPGIRAWSQDLAGSYLVQAFNRPLRVCGVVPNLGEPGGAPFWVREPDGSLSLQIVEGAQVDAASPEQRAIWEAATHFNPVDLVCGLRDDQGVPFELTRYVDHDAVFISRKSKNGRELKALEHPGLWNGAMARWLTLFVEVPKITFNPVKTVFDLLRPEHQPE